jgi:hypothetical protein
MENSRLLDVSYNREFSIPTRKECCCCCESAEISIVKGETMCITHHVAFYSIILGVDALHILRHDIISTCKSQEEKGR